MTPEQFSEVARVLESIAVHLASGRQYCPFCGAYRGGGYGYEDHRPTCALARVERLVDSLPRQDDPL